MPSELEKLFPELQQCECLMLQEGDIIIHAPGFEDRTMDIVDAVVACPGSQAILFEYLPLYSKNRLYDVKAGLSAIGIQIEDEDILNYDRFDPGDFELRLESRLRRPDILHAIVDISSMSKLLIMLVLNVCNKLKLRISILYCEAQRYHPNQEEFETAKARNEYHQPTLQIYTGVHGMVRADSLSSVAMQGQPTAAIVFMSFNDNLTQVLLNTIYPGRLFLINGRPPGYTWREKATAWIHEQVLQEWEQDNPSTLETKGSIRLPTRIASTLDYRETVSLLLQLYWHLSATHRILLAPSGSKMQAVGCYFLKALHPDIHIEYPSPDSFVKEYSEGVATRWILDLGNISERLKLVSEAERREYLEIKTNS